MNQRLLFLQFLAQTSDSPILLDVEKAEGVYIFEKSGKSYMDLISGISVSNLGHGNKRIIEAIKNQVDKYMHLMVYGEYVQNPQVEFAKKLAEQLPENLSSTYLVNSGSEAIEGAMKLAKRYTGKSKIFSFKNAYHGSTQGALSIMGDEKMKQNFRPLLPDIYQIEFNNFADLERIDNKTACVIIEPVQGEAGIILPNTEYFKALRKKCTETSTLLIFDEVQTGFGRTGNLFKFQELGVIPDILVLAKGIGGGMPLGAFVSSKEIMNSFTNNPMLGHITTFGGHPVSCAAALESLNIILEEKLVEKVEQKGKLFEQKIKHSKIQDFRRSGLMMAIEFDRFETIQKIVQNSLKNGIIVDWFLFNDKCIRIAPPLTISEQEIEIACEKFVKALNETFNENI
jgi:acetylornithine/succinyldiaminopimelate/putrescine aminotransferase